MIGSPDVEWQVPGMLRLPLAVLAERRPGITPWAEWSWRVAEVLEHAPDLPAWTVLREAAGRTLFLAGWAELALFPSDTANYRDNLQADVPLVWAVLRPVEAAPGLRLHLVTIDGGEAQLYSESGADLLEAVPMPPGVRAAAEAFVAQHHVERTVHKRRRG